MKLTKKILAVLASAVMMTGSVSSVSAAGYPIYDSYYNQASMAFKDRVMLNDSQRVEFCVKAKDGTILTKNKLEFRDNVSENKLSVYESGLMFVDSERYMTRDMMMQYYTELTGHRMYWSEEIDNYWSGDIYELPETLILTQKLPNGLDGSLHGLARVWDYKTAR